jgi:predicted RNA-binding protein
MKPAGGSGDQDLLLEDVATLTPGPGKVTLTSILGEEKTVAAEIDHIDFVNHRIVLRPGK